MPKMVYGYNPDGEWDRVQGSVLPKGWSNQSPKGTEEVEAAKPEPVADEAPKKKRGRPPKIMNYEESADG